MTRSLYVRCPYCRQLLDGALNLSGRLEPKDWDPKVCPLCGGLSVHDAVPGGLRPPGAADWRSWARWPDLGVEIARQMHLANLARNERSADAR